MTEKLDCSMFNVFEKNPTAVNKCTNGGEKAENTKKKYFKVSKRISYSYWAELRWAEQPRNENNDYILLKPEVKVFVCGMVRFS